MVEYHISAYGKDTYHTQFEKAAAQAIMLAMSSGEDATIDVIVYSEEDALAFGGDDAVEQYLEDPDASVFCRVMVKATTVGRIA